MRFVRVGAAALNQTPLDWKGNAARIRASIEAARARGVRLLCLPELSLSGYGCEDAFLQTSVRERSLALLFELAPLGHGMIFTLGLPLTYKSATFNAQALVVDGKVCGFALKKQLAGDGIHYEPRWFKAWPEGARADLEIDGVSYPIGDLRFEVGGVKIGFEICEDAWTATRSGSALARDGVDVILNPSASHFALGKAEVRRRMVLEGSRAFGVVYVYANLLGNEAGRAIYDGHTIIASAGRMLAEGQRLTTRDIELVECAVDVHENLAQRSASSSFSPDLSHNTREDIACEFVWPNEAPAFSTSAQPPWETSAHIKEEEFARAVALGLFDYLRKSRAQGFVVSLSGGADSSAIVMLISLMCRWAEMQLGKDALAAKLTHIADGKRAVQHLLTTAYQSTKQSGSITRNAAKVVAETVGAKHVELDVDAMVDAYVRIAEGALGRPLTWQDDDLALQNIQARTRAPSVWMLANVERKLLLATSNRSEAAVGYATMDGDTAGGLSPIAGIDKHFLRRWLVWLEKIGPADLAPYPALSVVNAQAPTAELRPAQNQKAQTDEDDLMPYDVLDLIERAWVRDRRSPVEIFRVLSAMRPEIQCEKLSLYIERFARLFVQNQWKRERFAPSFHLDDESLDPKTFYRYPILSSGLEVELDEMRALLREK